MFLKKSVRLTVIDDIITTLFQVIYPITASVLNLRWYIPLYKPPINVGSVRSGRFQIADVPPNSARTRHKFDTLASNLPMRLFLVYPELAPFSKVGINQEIT